MSFSRSVLLWMSENSWLRKFIPQLWFVRKAVNRFMPGESEEAALTAAEKFAKENICCVFTKLGENINHLEDADKVTRHYLSIIDKIGERKLDVELSVKLTQLGLDYSEDAAYNNCKTIAQKVNEKLGNTLFIDMEGSAYTERTIELVKKLKQEIGNVGLCVQAYLYRTEKDIQILLKLAVSLRLVKGAYNESADVAFPSKKEVNENYEHLAKKIIKHADKQRTRFIFATHDELLIEKLVLESRRFSLMKEQIEFQMLYGIKMNFLREINERGYKVRVLIAYGEFWYPWYMRRLAERPANVWFVLKNVFS